MFFLHGHHMFRRHTHVAATSVPGRVYEMFGINHIKERRGSTEQTMGDSEDEQEGLKLLIRLLSFTLVLSSLVDCFCSLFYCSKTRLILD